MDHSVGEEVYTFGHSCFKSLIKCLERCTEKQKKIPAFEFLFYCDIQDVLSLMFLILHLGGKKKKVMSI